MAVLRPLRLVIDNYPEGQVEQMEAVNNPEDAEHGQPQRAVFARPVHRAGRFPRGSAQAVFPARARDAKCGCATAISSPAPAW